jgi:hypothetical protein
MNYEALKAEQEHWLDDGEPSAFIAGAVTMFTQLTGLPYDHWKVRKLSHDLSFGDSLPFYTEHFCTPYRNARIDVCYLWDNGTWETSRIYQRKEHIWHGEKHIAHDSLDNSEYLPATGWWDTELIHEAYHAAKRFRFRPESLTHLWARMTYCYCWPTDLENLRPNWPRDFSFSFDLDEDLWDCSHLDD